MLGLVGWASPARRSSFVPTVAEQHNRRSRTRIGLGDHRLSEAVRPWYPCWQYSKGTCAAATGTSRVVVPAPGRPPHQGSRVPPVRDGSPVAWLAAARRAEVCASLLSRRNGHELGWSHDAAPAVDDCSVGEQGRARRASSRSHRQARPAELGRRRCLAVDRCCWWAGLDGGVQHAKRARLAGGGSDLGRGDRWVLRQVPRIPSLARARRPLRVLRARAPTVGHRMAPMSVFRLANPSSVPMGDQRPRAGDGRGRRV